MIEWGFAVRRNVAGAAAQRIYRLLVMIGLIVAAYFALSVIDHAARADAGVIDRGGKVGVTEGGPDPADNAKKDRAASLISVSKIHGGKSVDSSDRKAVSAGRTVPRVRKAALSLEDRKVPVPGRARVS